MSKFVVTGACGFIGSALVKKLLSNDENEVLALDKMGYASSIDFLGDAARSPKFSLIETDISTNEELITIFQKFIPDGIFHLAAETHVDKSIVDPKSFIFSNIVGTFKLLEAWRYYDQTNKKRFVHVSTDEVYGSLLQLDKPFTEESPYNPSSPYSASKASSDHLVNAWNNTFGMNTIITNCSNNFGPCQSAEKLIPKVIHCIIKKERIPIFGNGKQIRDWLYVEDHVSALELAMSVGTSGSTYAISSENTKTNLDLVEQICKIYDQKYNSTKLSSKSLISFVEDRPGHDVAYALSPRKTETELGWRSAYNFENAIENTIDWYVSMHNNPPK